MAYTKIKPIKVRLDHVIAYGMNKDKTENKNEYQELEKAFYYATNKDKTEHQYFVSGINCVPEIAMKEMICTKKQFGKEDKNLGYHAIQSFAKDETTPEIAHEIGVKLANEMWGEKFEVVVTTHLNTEHLHNHIIINSVSFVDGEKYNDCNATYAMIREISDNLCREYGISVIPNKKTKAGINYPNYIKGKYQNSNYYQTSRIDVDKAIGQAYSYKDFEMIMKKMGYTLTYRANKLSICREGYKRNIRIERAFGNDYTIDRLKERILTEHDTRVPFHEAWKRKRYYPKKRNVRKIINYHRHHRRSYVRIFVFYRYQLRRYKSKKNIKPLTDRQREAIKNINHYSEITRFLVRNKIHTSEDVSNYKEALLEELNKLESQIRKLNKKIKNSGYSDEVLKAQKYNISTKLKYVKSEVGICKEIEKQIPMIKEELHQEFSNGKENKQTKEVDDIERSRRGSR